MALGHSSFPVEIKPIDISNQDEIRKIYNKFCLDFIPKEWFKIKVFPYYQKQHELTRQADGLIGLKGLYKFSLLFNVDYLRGTLHG